jgi:uncharacterized protein (DUF924 family)
MQAAASSLAAPPEAASAVLAFWRGAGPSRWFAKDAAFDAEFRERFADAHFAAARGELEGWLGHPESAQALILLLDQYPRNAFRGTGHMFATDGLALSCARRALGLLEGIEPDLRGFVCLPFMHAEDLAVQEESVVLYAREAPDSLRWAIEHRDIIRRFGRFPHRNGALGRSTTPEEEQFLNAGGFAG